MITAGDGKESPEEFSALLKGLQEYYKPCGILEETFVDKIASCLWRIARALRAENGEIRIRLDTIERDRTQRKADESNLALFLASKESEPHPETNDSGKMSKADSGSSDLGVRVDLRSHQSGLEYLRGILQNAKFQIARDGYISKKTQGRIYSAFCRWDYWFAAAVDHFRSPEAKEQGPLSEDIEDPLSSVAVEMTTDVQRSEVIALIDSRLRMVSSLEEYLIARDKLETGAEVRSFSLPAADATDRILRYESQLDRELYRAMDQLERLQRQRKGEKVPPQLNINLGKRS